MTEIDWTQLTTEDFDGHTQFASLTPEEKLAWLAAIVQLSYNTRENEG